MRLNLHITRKDYSDAMFLPLKEQPWLRIQYTIFKTGKIVFALVAVYFLIENSYKLIFQRGRLSIVLFLVLVVALITYIAFLQMRAITYGKIALRIIGLQVNVK